MQIFGGNAVCNVNEARENLVRHIYIHGYQSIYLFLLERKMYKYQGSCYQKFNNFDKY